jgi:hypothetical protein
MKTSTETQPTTTVAASVAGEDLHCGEYVTLLNATCEIPSYMWDQAMLPATELVRLKIIPCEAGVPLKVFAVCLPFVYAKTAAGDVRTLDLRRQQIVRLDRAAVKEVWTVLKPANKKTRS